MTDENGRWRRQDESFWRAHHEAWKRSDLNQRQYCEAERIPLKAFGNWRAVFILDRRASAGTACSTVAANPARYRLLRGS